MLLTAATDLSHRVRHPMGAGRGLIINEQVGLLNGVTAEAERLV